MYYIFIYKDIVNTVGYTEEEEEEECLSDSRIQMTPCS